MIKTRCSSLDRIAACPGSIDPGPIPTNPSSPEAQLGTEVHDYLAHVVDPSIVYGGWVDSDQAEEYEMLCAMGRNCWRKLQGYFPFPTTELPLEGELNGVRLTGHADVFSFVGQPADGCGQIRIIDWKTGRVDESHVNQLKGYALLACLAYPEADTATVFLVRVREQCADTHHFTRAELLDWWAGICESVKVETPALNPSRHCGYCPKRLTCPAFRESLAVSTAMVSSYRDGDLIDFSSEDGVAELLDRVKVVEQCCEQARAGIKACVIGAGGSLRTSDGRELYIDHRELKSIDVAAGLPVLEETIGREALLPLLKVGKGDVEKAVVAPRGQKKARLEKLWSDLDQAGAMKITTQERLEVRRSVPQLEKTP